METLLTKARTFAQQAHANQIHGGLPLTDHLSKVEAVLLRFGFRDETLLASAWLHEILESTSIPVSEIENLFGFEITKIVLNLTKNPSLPRSESLPIMYAAIRTHPKSLTLKLADRIASVEASIRTKGALHKMYLLEYPSFRNQLKTDLSHSPMWDRLDKLTSYLSS